MSSSDSKRLVSTNLPISELIKFIKHSFLERDFNEVQNILMDNENNMKMEIENLRRDRDSVKEEICLLERTLGLAELEKLKLEEKLQKNQRKCDELEETVTRLVEEKTVSCDREKRAEKRWDKISAENSKMTNEKNRSIFELKEKINELKNKNLENERLVGVYQEKYKCSDTMIVKMGQEIEDLRHEKLAAIKTVEDLRLKQLEGDRVVEELKRENFEAIKTIDELRLKKSESDKVAALYKSRLEDLAHMLTVKVGDLANLVNDVRKLAASEEGGNMDFPDSQGKKDSSGNGSTPGGAENVVVNVMSPGVRSALNSTGSRNNGLSKKGDRNLVLSWTRKDDAHTVKTSPGSQSHYNSPQAESNDAVKDNEHREPRGSDDDENVVVLSPGVHSTSNSTLSKSSGLSKKGAHASGKWLISGAGCFSKIACSSSAAGDIIEIIDSDDEANPDGAADISDRGVSSNVGEDEMKFVQSPSSSQRSKRNRPNCMGNLFANSTAKRKRNMCTSGEDNILIHEKENEALKSTHDRTDCSSSRKYGEVSGQVCDSQTPFEKFNGLNDEVQWAWKRETLQMTKVKINLYSRRAIVAQIAKELKLIGAGVYQEFTNSCFGFLMQLDTLGASCNAALHCLFANEVIKADASPDELWYRVGDRFIRFSKYEYALVTGLSFGQTTFDPSAKHDPPASGLFLQHYQGRRLKMETLRRDFTDGVFRQSPPDALKVAKLLIVYYLLFGMDGRIKYIDKWAWTLIEDTDRWETFMWGKYTYQILLRYLQRVPTELPHSKRPSYHVYGYVWAFLIWAFEAIPELGIACGVLTCGNVLPRCLRWRFPKARVDIDGFYDRQMEVRSTLEASAEEQRQAYWEHIHDDLRCGVCYIHRDNPFKKKATTASSSRATPARRSRSTFAARVTGKRVDKKCSC